MAETKPVASQDEVVCEIEIAAPPERVFQALVDERELFVWWGREPSVELVLFEMDARPHGAWRFESKPRPGHEHGAVGEQIRRRGASKFEAHGKILEFMPPRLLVYSWLANWHDNPEQQTVVSWELEPTSTGTRVRVTHRGLAEEPLARKDYMGGWAGVLQLLKNFLSQEKRSVRQSKR